MSDGPIEGGDEFDQKLGVKMRRLRIIHGMTQQEVADLLGVSFQQVQKYEKGVNRITVKGLYTFTQHLNIAFDEMLEGIWYGNSHIGLRSKERRDIMRMFDQLTKEQNRLVLNIVTAFAKANKHH